MSKINKKRHQNNVQATRTHTDTVSWCRSESWFLFFFEHILLLAVSYVNFELGVCLELGVYVMYVNEVYICLELGACMLTLNECGAFAEILKTTSVTPTKKMTPSAVTITDQFL